MDESVRANATNLFVGNLAFNVDDARLRDLFTPFGTITRAVVGMNRQTGRSKGFGFIAFETHEQCEAAMAALSGHELDGRSLRLDFDPGLSARGEKAVQAAASLGQPYEKRASRSPSPTSRNRSPSP